MATKNILQVDAGRTVRIVDIGGGESVRRRLLALGFHPGDAVALARKAILRGPVLIKNIKTGSMVAIGRGIAQKIYIEPVDERS
jgi:Fe2+ transport system protein FeoA